MNKRKTKQDREHVKNLMADPVDQRRYLILVVYRDDRDDIENDMPYSQQIEYGVFPGVVVKPVSG